MYVCAVVLLLDFYCFPFVLVLRMVCITNVWGYMEVFPTNIPHGAIHIITDKTDQ